MATRTTTAKPRLAKPAGRKTPAPRERTWKLDQGRGVAPTTLPRAKQLAATRLSKTAAAKAGAGAFLFIEEFHNGGDAPSTTTITSGSGKRLRNAVVNLIF